MNTDSTKPWLRRVAAALTERPAAAVWDRPAAALICLASLAALAACSTSGSSSTPSNPASTSSPAAPAAGTGPTTAPAQSASPAVAAAPACVNGSLQVKLGSGEGYAGGVDEAIEFTNISGASCTLYGYPGVSLVSGSQAQIGLPAKRDTTGLVKLITLAPGATGNAVVQIVDALNFPAATCSPAKSTDLRVYPPGQTAAVYLPDSSEGCVQPVQVLFVRAVQAGS